MSRASVCRDCQEPFDVASKCGPLPSCCPGCTPAFRKRSQAVRDKRRQDRKAGVVRTVHCVDCGVQLEWSGLGRPKLRCPEHLKAHNRKMSRCRYASNVASAPELARERWRAGYRRNAERIRAQKLDQHYRKRYGLTAAEVEALREARAGLCEICEQPARGRGPFSRLHVDHCHASGRIRGLLCGACNTMIGLAGEDPDRLQAAIAYLAKFAAPERSA